MNLIEQIINFGYETVAQNVLTSSLVTITCILTLAAFYSTTNKQKFWIHMGVPGPKPLPFLGNFVTFIAGNRLKKELEWVQKYGKVYGFYMGNNPQLIVADPEVMTQICVKDFEVFPNHETNEFSHNYFKSFLIGLKDQQWKRTRALMTPTFTSGKIKRMFRFLDRCADDLVEAFQDQLPANKPKEEQQTQVDVKDLYGLFTMDAITTCCYGLKLERAGSINLKSAATRNEFVEKAMKLFEFGLIRIFITVTFPKSLLRLVNWTSAPDSQLEPIADRVRKLIDQRRGSQKKFDDYLQLLIDAKLDDQMELNDMDSEENHHAGLSHESLLKDQKQLISDIGNDPKNKVTLTDFEILANAVFLLAVGLETTSTLLAHCTYALAFHQEIQEKLYEEILKIAEFDEDKKNYKFDYDTLTSCKYLDSVLSEALRMLTPVIQLDRVSNREYHLEKYNLVLPKGTKINLAFYAVLNDPEYWPEPEKFNPERFMPGNREKIVPGSYCPFGLGPRHCLGMRFSLTEAKLALAKIIMNYRFEPAPGTKFPPEPKMIIALNNIKTPFVIVKPRI